MHFIQRNKSIGGVSLCIFIVAVTKNHGYKYCNIMNRVVVRDSNLCIVLVNTLQTE